MLRQSIELGWFFLQPISIEDASLNCVKMADSLISSKGEGLEILKGNLALSLHHLRYFIFKGVPENMDVFVGIGNEVRISHMQVVEVVGLEYRFHLPVPKLLGFGIILPIDLDNSGMSLVLAK